MNAKSIIVSIVMVATLIGVASAQQVIVKEKPGEGKWWISYSRKHAPEVFELHTGCKTLAAAKAEAQRLIAWSNSMQANSSWRLAIIEIEGEDAQAPKADGPQFPGWRESDSDAMNSLRKDTQDNLKKVLQEDVENVFKKKKRDLEDVFNRVKDFKTYAVRNVDKLSEEKFREVNALVSQYNSQANAYSSQQPGGEYFAALPQLTPLGPELLQKADDWRKAKEDQFALEEKKQGLDGDKERLETERERLIQEGREIKAKEERIASLERASASGDESGPLTGPFTLYTGQYSNTDGSKVGDFNSFQEARAAGQRHMSQNASEQPNYGITDKNGTRIEYDGLFGSKKVSDAQITRSAAPKDEKKESDQAELARLKAELAKRKSSRNDALSKYKSDLESYNAVLKEYEGATRSHKSRIEDLSNVTYNAPTGPRTAIPARPSASSSIPGDQELCYICWYGDFATYGGATRDEAIAEGRGAKQRNPGTRIRVTEHRASKSMTIDAISKTPGSTILEL
ncbi:MAG: hypothetical protein ACK57G_17340 [Planctomycetota bacterium]|jgi:hypothetical protein